jgi:hypothetical protein
MIYSSKITNRRSCSSSSHHVRGIERQKVFVNDTGTFGTFPTFKLLVFNVKSLGAYLKSAEMGLVLLEKKL